VSIAIIGINRTRKFTLSLVNNLELILVIQLVIILVLIFLGVDKVLRADLGHLDFLFFFQVN